MCRVRDEALNLETKKYCGVARKGPLLINGYASSSDFIGNDWKFTQQPTSEYRKHIRGLFLGNGYNRPLPRKSLNGTINPLSQQPNS
jgi:hypothetical protein